MTEAVFVTGHGGPEVLELRSHDPGEPGPGMVRVQVAHCGVNFIDIYFRTGDGAYRAEPPFPTGFEGAGTVESVGQGVDGLAPGDRVAWSQVLGSYASAVVAPAAALLPVPDGVALDQAAAVTLQGLTAHYLTHGVRQTCEGDVALVHAAAGGTGLLLVQMLKRAGARVLATCSTEAKAELARGAGADQVIRYTEEDFVAAVRAATEGRGVDVVYDSVGATTFDGSLDSLRPRGLLVLFGQASGPVPPFDLQRLNRAGGVFVTRPSLVHYASTREELLQRATAVFEAVAAGELSVRIGQRFPLAKAAEAQAALEGRATTGKVLLDV